MSSIAIGAYLPLTLQNKEKILSLIEKDYNVVIQLNDDLAFPCLEPQEQIVCLLEGVSSDEEGKNILVPETDEDIYENLANIFNYEVEEINNVQVVFYIPLIDFPNDNVILPCDEPANFISRINTLTQEFTELGLKPEIIYDSLSMDDTDYELEETQDE